MWVDLKRPDGSVYGKEFISGGTVPTHKSTFSAEELLLALADEFDAIDASVKPNVKKFIRKLIAIKKRLIDSTDQSYIDDIDYLLAQNLITQQKHDDLLQGLPL